MKKIKMKKIFTFIYNDYSHFLQWKQFKWNLNPSAITDNLSYISFLQP